MRIQKYVLFITLISLFLSSCGSINALILPKEKGKSYLFGRVSISDWTGRGGTITLFDKFNNSVTCSGERTLIEPSLTCASKKYYAKLTYSNERTVDFILQRKPA